MDAPTGTLSLLHAARLLGVHRNTARAWCRAGTLAAVPTRSGRWRVARAAVYALAAARRLTPARLAPALGVAPATVRGWRRQGLRTTRTAGGPRRAGRTYVTPAALASFLGVPLALPLAA
jgi:excisionase family DNA binding protein